MRNQILKGLLFSALFVGGTAVQASALSYTYDLTRWINGSSYGDVGASLGTVTISDDPSNSKNVDVVVNLNSGLDLLSLFLNYAGPAINTTVLTLDGTKEIVFNPNALKADGYSGQFDIRVPDKGNITGNARTNFAGVISDGSVDLDAADFDFLDNLNVFKVAAHIGEGTGSLPTGESSIWVGDGPPVAPVPEPASAMLLGVGAFILAIYWKRRRNGP